MAAAAPTSQASATAGWLSSRTSRATKPRPAPATSAPHASAAQRIILAGIGSLIREKPERIQALVRDVERLVERHRLGR
jgi:hypothetical protein